MGEQRLQQACALWGLTLPWCVAVGIHGSPWGGPILGHPVAAWAVLMSDFVLFYGALPVAAHTAVTLMQARGRTRSPARR